MENKQQNTDPVEKYYSFFQNKDIIETEEDYQTLKDAINFCKLRQNTPNKKMRERTAEILKCFYDLDTKYKTSREENANIVTKEQVQIIFIDQGIFDTLSFHKRQDIVETEDVIVKKVKKYDIFIAECPTDEDPMKKARRENLLQNKTSNIDNFEQNIDILVKESIYTYIISSDNNKDALQIIQKFINNALNLKKNMIIDFEQEKILYQTIKLSAFSLFDTLERTSPITTTDKDNIFKDINKIPFDHEIKKEQNVKIMTNNEIESTLQNIKNKIMESTQDDFVNKGCIDIEKQKAILLNQYIIEKNKLNLSMTETQSFDRIMEDNLIIFEIQIESLLVSYNTNFDTDEVISLASDQYIRGVESEIETKENNTKFDHDSTKELERKIQSDIENILESIEGDLPIDHFYNTIDLPACKKILYTKIHESKLSTFSTQESNIFNQIMQQSVKNYMISLKNAFDIETEEKFDEIDEQFLDSATTMNNEELKPHLNNIKDEVCAIAIKNFLEEAFIDIHAYKDTLRKKYLAKQEHIKLSDAQLKLFNTITTQNIKELNQALENITQE